MNERNGVLIDFDRKQDWFNEKTAAGIEANRKAFAWLKAVDANGAPVTDAHWKITQKTHDFKYGANLFMLDEFEQKEQNDAYRKQFADAFNIATLPFYWSTLEPEQGKPRFAKDSPKIYRRPAPDLCVEFCRAHGIEPKAHCLNYASFVPDWVPGDNIRESKRLLEKRFSELVERYAGIIPSWEVTNETFWAGQEEQFAFYGDADFVEWSFETADRYFHNNRLVINDAHTRTFNPELFYRYRSLYYLQIERALAKGARIDSIGMQFHMFNRRENEFPATRGYYDPEYLYEVMDVYAKLGAKLQITELTIPAYSNDRADEELQAEILRRLYTLWFSHPAMEAVIYWNLIDGFAFNAVPGDMSAGENYFYGGLLRYDFTPKPAYQTIRGLFEKTWRTNLEIDSCGAKDTCFKGFLGEYEIEVSSGERSCKTAFHLRRDVKAQTLTAVLK